MHRFFRALAATLTLVVLQSAHAADCSLAYLKDPAQPAADQLKCLQQMKADLRLSRLSRKDIDKVVGALYPRQSLEGNPADADIAILLVEEIHRRRPADVSRDDLVFGALMAAGRVEEAERLPYAKGLLIPREPLATPVAPGSVRLWTVQETPLKLIETTANLNVGRHILVYTSPGCGFCQSAAKKISADPLLGETFKAKSLWVHLPHVNYGPDFFREWTLQKYAYPTHVVFDRTGWPRQDIPATPEFFFIEDGQVVGRTLGWYKDSLSRMARQMADLGFLSP